MDFRSDFRNPYYSAIQSGWNWIGSHCWQCSRKISWAKRYQSHWCEQCARRICDDCEPIHQQHAAIIHTRLPTSGSIIILAPDPQPIRAPAPQEDPEAPRRYRQTTLSFKKTPKSLI